MLTVCVWVFSVCVTVALHTLEVLIYQNLHNIHRFSFEQLWFCSQKIIYRKEHRSDVILVLLLFMNDEAFFLVEIDFWSSLIPPRTIYLCTQLHWQFLTMRLIGSYFIQQISNLFMSLNIRLQILNVKL